MFEKNPIVSVNVKILKFWSLLLVRNWRLYACLVPSVFLNITQFLDMYYTKESVDTVIRNFYSLVLWFNTVLRAYFLHRNRSKFESFTTNLTVMYHEIERDGDKPMKKLLIETTMKARRISLFNLFLGTLVVTGFALFPLFTRDRVLPYGMTIPGIDKYIQPYYTILYVFQVTIAPIGCSMYIPFTSLLVSYMLFGTVLAQNLQHCLKRLKERGDTDNAIRMKIIWCVQYHLKVIKFTQDLNELITYISLLEFLTFGATLCGLLFLLNISKSASQIFIVFIYIFMIMNQLFTLYWNSTQLAVQNDEVAVAAYDSTWSDFSTSSKKALLLIILRAQRQRAITVGNVFPMTMETFQSIVKAAYSFYTILRRFYD